MRNKAAGERPSGGTQMSPVPCPPVPRRCPYPPSPSSPPPPPPTAALTLPTSTLTMSTTDTSFRGRSGTATWVSGVCWGGRGGELRGAELNGCARNSGGVTRGRGARDRSQSHHRRSSAQLCRASQVAGLSPSTKLPSHSLGFGVIPHTSHTFGYTNSDSSSNICSPNTTTPLKGGRGGGGGGGGAQGDAGERGWQKGMQNGVTCSL